MIHQDITKDIELIEKSDNYFISKNKELEERLKKIEIPQEELEKIKFDSTKSLIKDKVLGSFPIGELVKTIINWNQNIDDEVKKAKKNFLLAHYFEITKSNQDSINKLMSFLTNPAGNTIFNKILNILDNSPPDSDLLKSLAIALTKITNTGDFEKLFEKHKYALNLIEKLSPQSLVIISDYRGWPKFKLDDFILNGTIVKSDWFNSFVHKYCQQKQIIDNQKKDRISFSLKELSFQGFIEAHNISDEDKTFQVKITPIGREVLNYICVEYS